MTSLPAPTAPKRNRASASRAPEMARLYLSGKTLREIGEDYGVSFERVRQILAKQGLIGTDGGYALSSRRRAAERQAFSDKYWINRCGITRKELLEIPAKARSAYAHQRGAFRGKWDLKLNEWWDIWTRSGKWSQRGDRSGQDYVMARIRPECSFSTANVYICTLAEAARFGQLLKI